MAKSSKAFLEATERLKKENLELQRKLQVAKDSLDAIKVGKIDALVVPHEKKLKIFTEKTADKTYRILIEKMHEGAVTLNRDGTILYCNSCFAEMVNMPLQKLIGTQFKKLIDTASKENFEILFKKGWSGFIRDEVHIHGNDKIVMPVLMSVNTFPIDDIFVWSIILTDLSNKNLNELKLKNRAKQLEEKNLQLKSLNKELAFQKSEREKRAAELKIANKKLNSENKKKAKLAKELIIANKKLDFENVKKAKLAKELIIANKRLAYENAKKERLATELIIANKKLDIENEKKAELAAELIIANKELAYQNKLKGKHAAELGIANKKLKENEERFRLIVENVKDYAIILLDTNGYIKTWNLGAERINGYSAKEIIGKNISIFYTKEELRNKEPKTNMEMAKQEGRFESEGLRVRKDGSNFFADVIFTALYDDNNNFRGFSKITRDITERRKAESEIKKKSEELIKINKELAFKNEENEKRATELNIVNKDLTTFTYVSSHDLQEPLRKIKNFVSVLVDEEQNKLSDDGKKYLQRTYETAKGMQALIEDLLTYSRAKNPERKFEKTGLNIILDEVEKDFEDALKEKKAIIKTEKLCEVNIIRFQFHQLVQNLISNSLKFTKPLTVPLITIKSELVHGSKLNIEKLSEKINYCHIIYTDNGIGFEPQYNERIFEVFQRLHSKEEYEGTGMGLAICKRIVENHNGIITASGELNKGARFDIYIPA